MKQTFTKESIVLHEGEVLILATRHAEPNGYLYFPDDKEILKVYGGEKHARQLNKSQLPFNEIVCSTKTLEGVITIDRKSFVKSDPDIIFTMADMIQAVKYGAVYFDVNSMSSMDELDKEASDLIDSIRPLSIPASVTIENNQVIESETIWE